MNRVKVRKDLRKTVNAYVRLCRAHGSRPHVGEIATLLGVSRLTLGRHFRNNYAAALQSYAKVYISDPALGSVPLIDYTDCP